MRTGLVILFFVIVYPFNNLIGQEECERLLRIARERYEAGRVEDVPELLKDCLASGLTREDQMEAYKLIINSYLFDGFSERADSVMLSFLNRFPDYKPADADPAEFQQLLGSYRTTPVLSVGWLFGGNFSVPQLIEAYSTASPLTDDGTFKFPVAGFQTAPFCNIRIGEKAEMGFELRFMQNRFKYRTRPYTFLENEYVERQNRLIVPVSFIYRIGPEQKAEPYIIAGAAADYLLSAAAHASRSYTETGDMVFSDVLLPLTGVTGMRKRYNGWLFAGGGIRLNLQRSFWFADLRFWVGLSSANKGDERYIIPDLNWLIYYVDNDFRMNCVTFSIGYARNFYNPKKR